MENQVRARSRPAGTDPCVELIPSQTDRRIGPQLGSPGAEHGLLLVGDFDAGLIEVCSMYSTNSKRSSRLIASISD
jgi:hypothetical protein